LTTFLLRGAAGPVAQTEPLVATAETEPVPQAVCSREAAQREPPVSHLREFSLRRATLAPAREVRDTLAA